MFTATSYIFKQIKAPAASRSDAHGDMYFVIHSVLHEEDKYSQRKTTCSDSLETPLNSITDAICTLYVLLGQARYVWKLRTVLLETRP